MEAETRASAVAAGIREAVPEGHHYLPARPYPPERIPEEELVPMTPEPFNRVKDMPVSELVYDEELDEFVVPKGYVSEDEMIDDQSVVWHPENHTVACKFRGEEEPVIWPYWKPADLGDVPKRGRSPTITGGCSASGWQSTNSGYFRENTEQKKPGSGGFRLL